ncbi:cysteine dioxygenase [Croceiramulus getboli]|nr:cysteine dioxygenase family protein [Flavobacteriaceae bacterium YJPT1-3]
MQTETITRLDELLDALATGSRDYRLLANEMILPLNDLKPFLFWHSERYTRNCIVRTSRYELMVLCWEKGQETPIHCHGGQECWVHMVQGKLEEKRYKTKVNHGAIAYTDLMEDHRMTICKTEISYMNDAMGYHSLRNAADGRSISLHLYAQPIDECSIMDEGSGKLVQRQLSYDSVEGVWIAADRPSNS